MPAAASGSDEPKVVAVLGAGGTMGRGMVRNLREPFEVRAWNRTREKVADLADAKVTVCGSPREAARGADVVVTTLSDGEAVLAAQAGLVFVDAPVLGTKKPAEEGQLVILGSGPEQAREKLGPLFEAIGKRTLWAGEAGAGSRLKVAVNTWIVAVVEGTAEMLSLAEAVGLDPRLALEAVEDGPLDLPYLRLKAKAMLARDFTPSFRLALAAKDAALALEAAEEAGLDLPMLAAIRERMAEAARDHGDKDLAAVYLASSSNT